MENVPIVREEARPLDEVYLTIRQLDSGANVVLGGLFTCIRFDIDINMPIAEIQKEICVYKVMNSDPGSNNSNEIDKLKSMEGDHPSVIRLLHFGSMRSSWFNEPWITVPYYPAGSLEGLIHDMGYNLPDAFPWHVFLELGKALLWIHTQAKIAHRDLHIANILVDFSRPSDNPPYPRLVLADFGYATWQQEVIDIDWHQSVAQDFGYMAAAARATSQRRDESGNLVIKDLFKADSGFNHWLQRLRCDNISQVTDDDIQDELLPLSIEKMCHANHQDSATERFTEVMDASERKLRLDAEKAVRALRRGDQMVSPAPSLSTANIPPPNAPQEAEAGCWDLAMKPFLAIVRVMQQCFRV